MSRILIAATALAGGLLFAGCSQAADTSEARTDVPVETRVAAEAAQASRGQSPAPANCLIRIDGRVWLDQPCPWDAAYDQIIVNVGAPDGQDFVYLDRLSPTEANGNWSGGGGAGHAHDRLGTLTLDGDCWTNSRARICLPPAAQADFDRASQ